MFESLPSLLNIILTYRYVFTIVYDFVISFFCVASILSIYSWVFSILVTWLLTTQHERSSNDFCVFMLSGVQKVSVQVHCNTNPSWTSRVMTRPCGPVATHCRGKCSVKMRPAAACQGSERDMLHSCAKTLSWGCIWMNSQYQRLNPWEGKLRVPCWWGCSFTMSDYQTLQAQQS